MKDSFTEINIIPLVDIMLVPIVIILMTASFITTKSLRVNLPEAQSSQAMPRQHIRLEMAQDGSLAMQGKQITLDELAIHLSGRNREDDILISTDQNVTLQRFIHVLDYLKKENFSHISVQTQK